MKRVSQSINVKMLDYGPKFKGFSPDKIVAASGILTMRDRDFMNALGKIDDKALARFHDEATKRGHASLTTSVNFYFWLEGSRIIDFYFSSFPFGSYMIFSSRRVEIGLEHMVIPDSIADSEFKDEYEMLFQKMAELYHRIKEETGSIDHARRVLPIGFISKGLFCMPLQTVLGIIKEVREDDKKETPALPKEVSEIVALLEDSVTTNTTHLADAALEVPYNTAFPHPNLFKSYTGFQEPRARFLLKDEKFEKLLDETKGKLAGKDVKGSAEIWKDFVEKIQDKVLLKVDIVGPLSIWNDMKRHRTVRQKVESIYSAVERCMNGLDEKNFCMPKVRDPKLREDIIEVYKEVFELYERLVAGGIEKRDAIYIIPHGINLGMTLLLDGYHLFDPFGFLGVRACTTTDHELVTIANEIINGLERRAPTIRGLIGPKCKLGFCPERNFCGVIKKFVKDYDEETHMSFKF